MTELVFISGKGGTGKTTVTLGYLMACGAGAVVDADTDASNLPVALCPSRSWGEDVYGNEKAVVDASLCTRCGRCAEVCRFDAIPHPGEVCEASCEGCGVCALVCPEAAITFVPHVCGQACAGTTAYGTLYYAAMEPGEEGTGLIVSRLRRRAREGAPDSLIVIDGPPGLGCPVIASLSGVDAAVIVTEPTVSGQSDLARVAELCMAMGLRFGVCVNRHDINPAITGAIRTWCADRDIPYIGQVPYCPALAAAAATGDAGRCVQTEAWPDLRAVCEAAEALTHAAAHP
jgi:MinD superfamily P-loop ATPase